MELLDIAIPVVEDVAKRTKNRTDDEIVALINEFRLALPTGAVSAEVRAAALVGAGVSMLRRLGLAGEKESVLRLAIELAVSRLKGKP